MQPEILISIEAEARPRSVLLEQGITTFGRDTNNGVCFDDPSISRDHGAFYNRFGVLAIEDHGSTNGTFVNGLRVKRKVLYAGDCVTIGSFEMRIKHGSEQPAAILQL